jgi:O-antigen/teichoic acid export membrane protein
MRHSRVFHVSKNASMLLAGTVLRMAFTFGFVVYAARYLGVEGYGKFALTQSLFELCLSLVSTGIGILVTREAAKNVNWLSRHLAPSVALTVLLGACATGLLVMATRYAGYAADTCTAIQIASLAVVPASLAALAEAVFIALGNAEVIAIGTALESFVRIGAGIIALLLGRGLQTLFVILIVMRTAQLLFYAAPLARRLPQIEWRFELRTLSSLVFEGRIFAAETWLAILYSCLDVVLLSLYWGEAAVGLYDAAWKLIRLGPVVASSVVTAIFPLISQIYANSRDSMRQISEYAVKYALVVILPAALCITIFAERIVLLLFKQDFASSAPALQVLAWLLVPQFLNQFLSRVLYARGQQRRSLAVAVIGLVSFMVAALILIPRFGVIGTAWSAVFSSYVALASFILYCTAGTDRRPMLIILLKQLAVTIVMCLVLSWMKYVQWQSVVAACVLLYGAMLVAFRILSIQDVTLLRALLDDSHFARRGDRTRLVPEGKTEKV